MTGRWRFREIPHQHSRTKKVVKNNLKQVGGVKSFKRKIFFRSC